MPSRNDATKMILQRLASKVGLEPSLIEDVYPCTYLQASLVAADLQGSGKYVSTFVFELSQASCSPPQVKAACERLHERTPILRTRVIQSKGKFLQVVTKCPLRWSETRNLQDYLDSTRHAQVQLGEALAQFGWIEEGNGDIYMVWSLHHSLYDEWSINLLFNDLSLLIASSKATSSFVKRPSFARFIKSLGRLDQHASTAFWQEQLRPSDQYLPILPQSIDKFETSQSDEFIHSLDLSKCNFQFSTLVITAWSMCMAKTSESDIVVFGNIVNGRACPVPGIVDICGPTMTTVPYVVKMTPTETLEDFMDRLQRIRTEMLPHEQMGLHEYRQRTGAGRFDTILSVRTAEPSEDHVDGEAKLQPRSDRGRQVQHPCLMYLDVKHQANQCTLKISFDGRFIDAGRVSEMSQQLFTCLDTLTENPYSTVSSSLDSIAHTRISRSSHPPEIKSIRSNGMDTAVDPHIMEIVQTAAQGIGTVDDANRITPDTTLRELGLDSLSTVILNRRLSESLNVSIPYKEVTGLRLTLLEIARSIQTIVRGTVVNKSHNSLDLLALAEQYARSFELGESTSTSSPKSKSVLLTGATGFVGSAILRQLLIGTKSRLILLVRCDSPEHGMERVRQSATKARWSSSELTQLEQRVRIWPSDLRAPQLGLSTQHLDSFDDVGHIIHNGAKVDFSLSYDDLEATNVAATSFLLTHHLKTSQRPSMVYVTGGRGCPIEHEESAQVVASRLARSNGYAQTKFVGELLLQRARELCIKGNREASMTIVHPGIIIGDTIHGLANTDDFIWRYVSSSLQMGCYVPAVPTKREWINLMPVDRVARDIVSLCDGDDLTGNDGRYLMRSGMSVEKFWDVIIATLHQKGLTEPISEWEWLLRFKNDLHTDSGNHPLFPLSSMLLQGHLKGIGGLGPRLQLQPSKTESMILVDAVAANVRYLQQIGYFSRDGPLLLDGEVFGRSK